MIKKLTASAVLALLIGVSSPWQTAGTPSAPAEPDTPNTGNTSIEQPVKTSQKPFIVNSLQSASITNDATTPAPQTIKAPQTVNHTYATALDARRDGDRAIAADGTSHPLRTYKALAVPNDPYANQSFVMTANLSAAWDVPRGDTPTLLAIIDSGFALQHEEFANRFYQNPGESGAATSENPSMLNCTDRSLALNQNCNLIDDNGDGIVDNEVGATTYQNPSRLNCTAQSRSLAKDCNMIDDDANGYIDDVTGWDFINNDRSVQAGEVTPTGEGVHHGTYVLGAAAATGNNGVGLAGADWGTTILPIQVLDDEGYGDTVGVANAIKYATARGANVISLSLGSDIGDNLVRQAVREAIAAGAIVVAAAGNDGCNCIVYPANYPEVVAVGASQSNGQPASFSSYGANLDILAPGVNLHTTDWLPSNQTSAYAQYISGTSLATPVVSGLLTRLKSQRPTASSTQLIAVLTETANHLGLTAASPRSNTLGYGLIHAGAATQRLSAAYAPTQIYNLAKINQSGSGAMIYQCESSVIGTTPIYEMKKTGTIVFTTNIVEQQTLATQGYTTSLFAYSCMTQPHDTPQTIRSIDVFSEFRNLFLKV